MSVPHHPEAAPLKCFVVMPFTTTEHKKDGVSVQIAPSQWLHIFQEWIKKAVESYPKRKIVCNRSPATPGNFIKGIVQDLNDAHLVVADLTGNRPNVYYELGIRNTLRTGTVMITQDLKALPGDLQTYYCFEYAYTEKTHEYDAAFKLFKEAMHEKLGAIIEGNFPSDNPVSDFLGFSHYHQVREFQRTRALVRTSLVYVEQTTSYCEDFFRMIEVSPSQFLAERDYYEAGFSNRTDISLLSAALTRLLFDYNLTLFPEPWATEMQISVVDAYEAITRLVGIMKTFEPSFDANENNVFPDSIEFVIGALDSYGLNELIEQLDAFTEPASR